MQDPTDFYSEVKSNVTDVEFKEVPTEAKEEVHQIFNPFLFLTDALIKAGYPDPVGWSAGIDSRVETADNEKDRIFFANRALRLYLAEVEGRENISPRMLLADGIDSVKWAALMEQGIIPWLMNQFDKKGKRMKSEDTTDEKDEVLGQTPPDTEESLAAAELIAQGFTSSTDDVSIADAEELRKYDAPVISAEDLAEVEKQKQAELNGINEASDIDSSSET